MRINAQNRNALKVYFEAGATPRQNHFEELIEGMLNQADDGIVKQSGHPLSIQAEGEGANAKVLNIYQRLTDDDPAWTLSLNRRGNDTSAPGMGLAVSDGSENLRLFIDHSSGNVGIGTNDPGAKLDITLGANDNNNVLRLQKGTASYLTVLNNGNVGIGGVSEPRARLEVHGGTTLRGGTTTISNSTLRIDGNHQIQFADAPTNTGLRLVLSNGQGIGVNGNTLFSTAGSHSWRDSSSRDRMLLSTAENGGLTVSGTGNSSFAGNLGLGTTSPRAKLDIAIGASDNINPLTVVKGSTNYLTVHNNGNIGIGTTSPGGRLAVAGVAPGGVGVEIVGTVGNSHIPFVDGSIYLTGYRSGSRQGDFIFRTFDGTTYTNRFVVRGGSGTIDQEAWRDPAPGDFRDGWRNYAGGFHHAGYFKDSMGIVHLKGLVTGGTVGDNSTIFILPTEYRPSHRVLYTVNTGNVLGRVDIRADGRVVPFAGNNTWLSLEGITFRP
jgi:hypothetical protein